MNKSMKQLTQFAACAVAALSVVACSSEDSAQQDNAKQNTAKGVATFDGSQPGDDTRALTRTTATYTLGGDAKVFWTSADKIFVQDDANTFHQSGAANLYNPSNKAKATFSLASGSFTLNNREVRYTGENGTDANTVTIATTQTQTTANDFSHLGTSGDCGTATAIGSNGNYTFTLNHKASYLCFVPRCMNTDLGPNIKLTKIKVTANQPIAGKYDFSTGSLAQKAGETYSNTITLNTSDFSLNTTVSSLATNGAYMVVAPGTYNFTITYTIKDPTTNVSGTIVKQINSLNCAEGKISDITANIMIDDVSGTYYTWDGANGNNYWKGHDRDASGKYLSTLTQNGSVTPNYPTAGDSRWYNTAYGYQQSNPATRSAANQPNINFMAHYVNFGDPHWDADKIWSVYGHLFKGGIWLKKKTTPGFPNKYNDFWGIDYRNSGNGAVDPRGDITYTTPIPLTELQKVNYFFLPASGYYENGKAIGLGQGGHYWTSSASSSTSVVGGSATISGAELAWYIFFDDHRIHVRQYVRRLGSRIATFY